MTTRLTNGQMKLLFKTRMKTFSNFLKLILNQEKVINTNISKSKIKSLHEMPGPWPSLPLIGTGWQYYKIIGKYDICKIHSALHENFNKYGPIFKEEYERGKAIVNVCDPNDFEIVFRAQGKCPTRGANEFVRYYRMNNMDKYPNVGLAHMIGEEW